jgi:uncharacterized membrane protein
MPRRPFTTILVNASENIPAGDASGLPALANHDIRPFVMNENPETTPTPAPTPPPESQSAPVPPPAPAPGPAAALPTTGLDPTVACGLCAVFPLVGGIVFMIIEKQNALVKFWAMQSLYFGVFALVASIAVSVVSMILAFIPILGWLIGFVLWLVLTLGLLALWVMGVVNAFQGKRWKMPVLGDMVEKQLASQPAA